MQSDKTNEREKEYWSGEGLEEERIEGGILKTKNILFFPFKKKLNRGVTLCLIQKLTYSIPNILFNENNMLVIISKLPLSLISQKTNASISFEFLLFPDIRNLEIGAAVFAILNKG